MPDTNRSLIQRVAAAAALIVALAVPAGAQQQQPAPASDSGPGFMTRYDFHLEAASLAINDQRFSWDTHFGGEIDAVDYVVGRTSILVDYEAVLGNEYRPFDPNQSNYTLETSTSARIAGTEIAGVFHHVSRHLSDRAKRFSISWNTVGARVLRRVSAGDTTLDLVVEAERVVQHSYVDYSWTGQIDLTLRRQLVRHVAVFAHATGELIGVDPSLAHRDTQRGGLAEVGVHFGGRAGALELFVGVERRIDADPLDRQPQQWGIAGFRLVNR
jgi:hypothetical protein